MTSLRRISIKAWAASFICVVGFAGCALAATHLNDNFHAIVAGEAYRSAQPSADEIRAYRDEYHIATIINLRGQAPGRPWYDTEVRTAKDLRIRDTLGNHAHNSRHRDSQAANTRQSTHLGRIDCDACECHRSHCTTVRDADASNKFALNQRGAGRRLRVVDDLSAA